MVSTKKLLEFQKKVGAITKDSSNPFFKSKYFDINKVIDVIKPILNEVGLVILQPVFHANDKLYLRTMIIDAETGEQILDSDLILQENSDPQKMGSVITYFRRYAITSLLFLQGEEDDDANKAKGDEKKPGKWTAGVVTKAPEVIKPVAANNPFEVAKVLVGKMKDVDGLIAYDKKLAEGSFTEEQKTEIHNLINAKVDELSK